ncbi:SRPBCC domain-containing protein [Euzebya tangerina]|uniref:SRPBCC domain-containing protein n=1 Tax=Euzebya tangerina TaxID=591198 RepID=UPI000E31F84D|nr:SRPBCC domain-containing protein [Euzebya tangerina]
MTTQEPHFATATHDAGVLHATEVYERRLAAELRSVWSAWTDPERKRRWFAPTAKAYDLDVRPGGTERLLADVEGAEVEFSVIYLDVVEGRRLIWSSQLRSGGRLATAALTTVLLEPFAGGTTLSLTEHATFLDGMEAPEWRKQGTADWLDALVGHIQLDTPS